MTNKEIRLQRQREALTPCLDYDSVFSFEHIYESARKCLRGVMWKSSTQSYRQSLLLNAEETYEIMRARAFKSRGFYEFDIVERGKPRHIRSVHITERAVQKCLCDYSLVPVLSRSLIYDNGACLKDKGVDFTLNRLKEHLRRHYMRYGREGYVVKFDFARYFDNINHDVLKAELHEKYATSPEIEVLVCGLIDDFGTRGLGLGSQISQICTLYYPNRIDHFFKDEMRIEGYGRYMDDGYIITRDKCEAKRCLDALRGICDALDISLNSKKTQIARLTKGVPFLKRRFALTGGGRVLELPRKSGAGKERRKARKLREPARARSLASWNGHMARCDAYCARRRVYGLFERP